MQSASKPQDLAGLRDSRSHLEVSEIFSSIQGEGISATIPCLFLRLAICNLRCSWCDTRYTWDFRAYRYEDEVSTLSCEAVREQILRAPERRVVVTGGEPLLQQAALGRMLATVPREITVELETNGTILPNAELLDRIDQWNVSPKLAHSGEPERRRVRLEALALLRQSEKAYLKLVVRGSEDLAEAEALVQASAWPVSHVLLMPEVTRSADYPTRADRVEALCRARGYRFSPRLHVLRWGGARGK